LGSLVDNNPDRPVSAGIGRNARPSEVHRLPWPGASALAAGAEVCAVTVPAAQESHIEVRRSARRTRTVSAYRDGERVIVMIPARFSRAEEAEWVARMVARLDGRSAKRRQRNGGDELLARRARELSAEHLDGRAVPASIRWVDGMRTRWGSCTPADATIRISDRLQQMPAYVRDYVIFHELAHLLVPGHNGQFWALVARFPHTERARGYLEGISAAAGLDLADAD
jgi:predicted metal-dependent hydrolase